MPPSRGEGPAAERVGGGVILLGSELGARVVRLEETGMMEEAPRCEGCLVGQAGRGPRTWRLAPGASAPPPSVALIHLGSFPTSSTGMSVGSDAYLDPSGN